MTENPKNGPTDYNALAAKYLDLWQEQIAKLAKEPQQLTEAATAWSRTAASMMQNAASTMGSGMGAGMGSGKTPSKAEPHEASISPDSPAASTGTETPGVTHGDRGLDSAVILRRLDALERRMAALESDTRRLAALESNFPKSDPSGGGAGRRKKT